MIHPSAVIDPGAELGVGCSVGPFSVIGPHARIGDRSVVGSHVVIEGHTTLGAECQVFQFASIGSRPQDLKYRGEPSRLEIGARNVIREYATLQPGTEGGGMITSVGDNNLFMANSHVGHDCRVGSNNVFANSVALAGHVTVGSSCIVGGLAGIHQFVTVGDLAFVAAGAMLTHDLPPFCIAQGDRAVMRGINVVGLQRRGFSESDIKAVKGAYRTLFRSKGVLQERIAMVRAAHGAVAAVIEMLSFVERSTRGLALAESDGAEQ